MNGRGRDSGLFSRLERVANACDIRRLEQMDSVRLERLGAAVAALCPARPELDFVNRIHGPIEDPEPVLRLYRASGLRPWAETVDELPGWERLGVYHVLAGPPLAPEPELEVREGDAETFARTFLAAVGGPEGDVAALAAWPVRSYVAYVGGVPAAAGALYVDGGIGLLANVATLPAFRRRGAQTALIRRRIQDAAEAGCELVTAGTSDAISRRNLERSGLSLVYTKTVWRGPK
jgi:GNAT superfamily N-acetyltransferase